ncbi:kynureninase [Leucobacter massiliensis]|uniref:Kynureninase n=1 Tax=Leucobacter massiliensis TaxID=1686285 RepID=A0A2S9QM30_9MICO|nr:kynureninase [Leucobacter massiliensis]PRI10628.1 kynureninase [Leucobacter massiliensis]
MTHPDVPGAAAGAARALAPEGAAAVFAPLPAAPSREQCLALDAADPLAASRELFALPAGVIYLDGNSLGAMPRNAPERAREVVEQEWGRDLIGSWNKHHWFELPTRLGAKIARLVGGERGACVVTDTTSVNIFKVLGAALELQRAVDPGRRVIVSERENFPTDLYVIEGMVEWLDRGYELRLIDEDAPLEDALGVDVAVVLLTQVNYRTGRLWDLAAATAQIHASGALAIWDLCHSAGAVPVGLDAAGADFAVGCSYKYLNGGPGSPAFVWVGEQHLGSARQPLTGWWGHARPFDMEPGYEPASDIRRFQVGTQPILSLATAECGIDIALGADGAALRRKSIALSSLFIELVETRLAAHPLTLVTPRDPARRGSHVSFRHPEGFAVMKALIAQGVIGDYREPEVLRFGFAPLYNGFAEVWDAVEALRRVLDEELWRAPEFGERGAVT